MSKMSVLYLKIIASGLKRAPADAGSASAVRGAGEDLSQVTYRTALRIANEGSPLEIENYSGDSFDEGSLTAVGNDYIHVICSSLLSLLKCNILLSATF